MLYSEREGLMHYIYKDGLRAAHKHGSEDQTTSNIIAIGKEVTSGIEKHFF
ncbi:MAG: hypothetical protein VYC17_06730 [Nitrospinota bacterium]|nr:hypothetical protein [Nitrospinota bacterium]